MTNTEKMRLFKKAMDKQNEATRVLLCLRGGLLRELRGEIPAEDNQICVVVSLKEFCNVRSLDADDYRVRTQVDCISNELAKCHSADELLSTIRTLAYGGSVWNGRQYIPINNNVRSILRRYARSGGHEKRLAVAW